MKKTIASLVFAALIIVSTTAYAAKNWNKNAAVKDPVAIEEKDSDFWWLKARELVYKHVQDLIDQNTSEVQRNVKHSKFIKGDPEHKWVALTFDDGPHPDFTPKILSILKANHVKATFFVVGMMAETFPKLVKSEYAAGHNVGNHTYHHVNLTKTPVIYVAAEIKACGQIINSITGKAPHLFRPPGGDYNDTIASTADKLGYTTVLWTVDPGDYAKPGESIIVQRTVQSVSNGGVILLHDGVQQTIDILPSLIRQLKDKGFTFVTIDEMMSKSVVKR